MLAIMDKYAKVLSTVEADLKPPELSGVGPSDRERWLTTCQRLANDAKAIVQASEAEGVEQVEKDAFDRHIERTIARKMNGMLMRGSATSDKYEVFSSRTEERPASIQEFRPMLDKIFGEAHEQQIALEDLMEERTEPMEARFFVAKFTRDVQRFVKTITGDSFAAIEDVCAAVSAPDERSGPVSAAVIQSTSAIFLQMLYAVINDRQLVTLWRAKEAKTLYDAERLLVGDPDFRVHLHRRLAKKKSKTAPNTDREAKGGAGGRSDDPAKTNGRGRRREGKPDRKAWGKKKEGKKKPTSTPQSDHDVFCGWCCKHKMKTDWRSHSESKCKLKKSDIRDPDAAFDAYPDLKEKYEVWKRKAYGDDRRVSTPAADTNEVTLSGGGATESKDDDSTGDDSDGEEPEDFSTRLRASFRTMAEKARRGTC